MKVTEDPAGRSVRDQIRRDGQLTVRPRPVGPLERMEAAAARPVAAALNPLATVSDHFTFYGKVLRRMPAALRYRREILNLVSEVVVGRGALIVGAGILTVMLFLNFAIGNALGIEAFDALEVIGADVFAGLAAAYGSVRFLAPLVAGIALAAQVGCGFTAELGAQRISDEVDALEVMSVDSITYLVATRVWALLAVMAPLYLGGLLATFVGAKLFVVDYFGQSEGVFDHYFELFLPPSDIIASYIQGMVYAVAVALIHCYYGYYATGGPVGVGQAAGRAIRTSLIAISALQMILFLILYGGGDGARIVGTIVGTIAGVVATAGGW